MTGYIIPALLGLLLGLTLHWTGFTRPWALRQTLALRCSHALRSGLYTLGFGMALTALLCYLAVIDVDTIEVLPLSAAVIAGGMIFGVAAGWCGFTPVTAMGGIGGGPLLEALCTAAGCLAMTLLLPSLEGGLTALREPVSATTLFRLTLDEPYLLPGGFLGQGSAGLVLMLAAACIPSNRRSAVQPEEPPVEEVEPEIEPADPDTAPADAFVAILPGEEPLVVDTAEAEDTSGEGDEKTEDENTENPPSSPLPDMEECSIMEDDDHQREDEQA
ncbi:MAG: hypothetical protein IJ438_13210 [Clostridia bacterium]|nr:hypothetical protein [Clostridia bacterium]